MILKSGYFERTFLLALLKQFLHLWIQKYVYKNISNEILTNRRHRNMDEGAMYNNKYNYALR